MCHNLIVIAAIIITGLSNITEIFSLSNFKAKVMEEKYQNFTLL